MIFIDNKYTRAYYAIVNRAKIRITTEKTEDHHIIPESFYLNRTRKGRKGWLDGDPDAPENLVYLTLHEHFVCHLLLTKMVVGTEAQYKVDSAAAWLADCYLSKDKGVRITGRIYAKLRLAAAKAQSVRKTGQVAPIKGMTAWNNGIFVKMAFDCPGPDFVKGSLTVGDKRAHAKGTKWWNNGVTAVMQKESPGIDWSLGNMKTYNQLATTLGTKSWIKGGVNKMSKDCPGPGWILGSLKKGRPGHATTTGKQMWNNGVINKFSVDQPGPDYILGRLKF